eukprot:COSAG01_NODE_6244_length_3770_cov_36.061530_8_plen_46_part_01
MCARISAIIGSVSGRARRCAATAGSTMRGHNRRDTGQPQSNGAQTA